MASHLHTLINSFLGVFFVLFLIEDLSLKTISRWSFSYKLNHNFGPLLVDLDRLPPDFIHYKGPFLDIIK